MYKILQCVYLIVSMSHLIDNIAICMFILSISYVGLSMWKISAVMYRFFYVGITRNLDLGEWPKDVFLVVAHILGTS